MSNGRGFRRRMLILTGLLLAAGCAGTPNSQFYLLSALPQAEQHTTPETAAAQDRVLGIGPVEFPDYLDRPQIVTRLAGNALSLAEFDRWGEPLKSNFTRVLAENLAVLLDSERILFFPWDSGVAIDYQIAVRVLRFDATVGGDSLLTARWRIIDRTGQVLRVTKASYSERPQGEDYPAIVAAMNRTLTALSRDIATALDQLSRRR